MEAAPDRARFVPWGRVHKALTELLGFESAKEVAEALGNTATAVRVTWRSDDVATWQFERLAAARPFGARLFLKALGKARSSEEAPGLDRAVEHLASAVGELDEVVADLDEVVADLEKTTDSSDEMRFVHWGRVLRTLAERRGCTTGTELARQLGLTSQTVNKKLNSETVNTSSFEQLHRLSPLSSAEVAFAIVAAQRRDGQDWDDRVQRIERRLREVEDRVGRVRRSFAEIIG